MAQLVSVLLRKHNVECLKNDLQIQPNRPLANVLVIEKDTLLHLVDGFSFAATTVDLCEPRNARLNLVPQHVAFDLFAIIFVVSIGMRPRTNQRHRSFHHVEQLRQLVQRRLSQNAADFSNPHIALGRLRYLVAVFADAHRSEFPNLNRLAIQTVSALLEENRSF